jgi:hypothetical protein
MESTCLKSKKNDTLLSSGTNKIKMEFKIIADTFSVARDNGHFIQIKSVKKPRTEEEVWLTINIEGGSTYARSTVQNMIEVIEEVFFEKSELSVYERFENTLKEINLTIKNSEAKKGAKALGDISAIIAVFAGSELHLTQSQKAEAYLVRQGKLSMISEGLSGRSKDVFVNIASGELLPDDKIIFTTSRLLRIATHSQLIQILRDGVTESVDAIRELVMPESELSLGVACLHIKLPQRLSTQSEAKGRFAFLNPIGNALEKIWESIAGKIGKKIPIPKPQILITLGVAIIILIISISVLMDSQRNDQLRNEYRTRIEALNQDLQVANTKGYANDKETANAILDKVERETRDILGANFFRLETLALLEKVQTTRDNINNTNRLKEVKPYIDLTKKNEAIEATGFVNLKDNFFVHEYNQLYEIILDQVLDPQIIDESEVVRKSTVMEDQKVIVFLTQSGRIVEYVENQFNFANTNDESWQSGSDIAAYGRNIYLLNPEKNQIYKYSRLRGQYSGVSEYNTDADLKEGVSIAIDGNIYVLKKGGEIIKLFKSQKQPFRIEDLAEDLSNTTKIYTATELDHLYLLDPESKRVIIVEKDPGNGVARYLGQVIFENLNVKDIYVDKNENKLFLLTSKAIYQVDI